MAQPFSEGCENDSVKQILRSDYRLLLEYATLGEDYDSVTTLLRANIQNLKDEVYLCDYQQEQLEDIITELKNYATKLEKEVSKNRKKMKLMKLFAYCGVGSSAVLTLILILQQ